MRYYAHSVQDKPESQWQTLEEHLLNTAQMAEAFAAEFNGAQYGYTLGLLHDLGKYSAKFQDKLKGKRVSVDHSTAGAKTAIERYGQSKGLILAYAIAGHHAGLPDGGNKEEDRTLTARLLKEVCDYSAYRQDIEPLPDLIAPKLPLKFDSENVGLTLAFFIRMLYSCLVDADFMDTEKFYNPDSQRGNHLDIQKLDERLKAHLKGFKDAKGKINQKRAEILSNCIRAASKKQGLFSLTVPTGGGKTLSSLAFALNHARLHGLKRIIYVIPYTSIIEQNAAIFKKSLGHENVLEHHSNFSFEENGENNTELTQKLKLASENWDIPIVVTTNVQFFESLFANKSSKSRKLHNIAKSVLIFDEAQMLPLNYLRPCIQTICELVRNYYCSAILCTATQPALHRFLPKDICMDEITDCPKELYHFFKRVEVIKRGSIDDESLSQELCDMDKVLCIVNTRKHANKIYERIKGKNTYHLSTLMCPAHRSEIIHKIREDLENKTVCRVVSTQLIEAGVDLDFKNVYRAAAGIDSIVQAAGRCNRNGKEKHGKLFIFNSTEKHGKTPNGILARTAKISDMVLNKYDDPISLEAIEEYFGLLYDFEGEQRLDREEIMDLFQKRYKELSFNFEEAASKFKLIKEDTVSITIPFNEEAVRLIEDVKSSKYPKSLLRQLQPYTVSTYEREYIKLEREGVLDHIGGMLIVLTDSKQYYDSETGLNTLSEESYGDAIFA